MACGSSRVRDLVCHSSNLSCCNTSAGSLAYYATREVLHSFFFYVIFHHGLFWEIEYSSLSSTVFQRIFFFFFFCSYSHFCSFVAKILFVSGQEHEYGCGQLKVEIVSSETISLPPPADICVFSPLHVCLYVYKCISILLFMYVYI